MYSLCTSLHKAARCCFCCCDSALRLFTLETRLAGRVWLALQSAGTMRRSLSSSRCCSRPTTSTRRARRRYLRQTRCPADTRATGRRRRPVSTGRPWARGRRDTLMTSVDSISRRSARSTYCNIRNIFPRLWFCACTRCWTATLVTHEQNKLSADWSLK